MRLIKVFSDRIIPNSKKSRSSCQVKVTAEVKVDASAASGLQVKNSSNHPKVLLPLEVFSDSAASALPAT